MPNRPGDPGRATLSGAEVKAVLALFRVGPVLAVHDFRKGSTRLAKGVVTTSDGGKYLLKRRSGSTEDLARIAYTHDVQTALMGLHFPVPAMIGSHRGETWVPWEGHLYELFRFIEGDRFRRTAGEARESGLFLARLHKTLSGWRPRATPPHPGGYHRSKTVAASWSRVRSGVHGADPAARAELIDAAVHDLKTRHTIAGDDAAVMLAAPGREARASTIHGDFHPGNILFVAGNPVVMIDFDAVRPDQMVIDVGNGCLQFGMHPVGDKPVPEWVATLNLNFIEAFLSGYALSSSLRLTREECHAVPSLMIEAAIAECVPRIAIAGVFAKRPGLQVLQFLREKTGWIWAERERIATLCQSCMGIR